MKALLCQHCTDIRALAPDGSWTVCRCGNVEARWTDPSAGTVSVRASDRSAVRIIGLNNSFLHACFEQGPAGFSMEDWRAQHERAVSAPGYLFDRSNRACWAVVYEVGQTGDTTWEPTPSAGSDQP